MWLYIFLTGTSLYNWILCDIKISQYRLVFAWVNRWISLKISLFKSIGQSESWKSRRHIIINWRLGQYHFTGVNKTRYCTLKHVIIVLLYDFHLNLTLFIKFELFQDRNILQPWYRNHWRGQQIEFRYNTNLNNI